MARWFIFLFENVYIWKIKNVTELSSWINVLWVHLEWSTEKKKPKNIMASFMDTSNR